MKNLYFKNRWFILLVLFIWLVLALSISISCFIKGGAIAGLFTLFLGLIPSGYFGYREYLKYKLY